MQSSNSTNKLISIMIAFILIIGVVFAMGGFAEEAPTAYAASGNWLNYKAAAFAGGTGTAEDPYLISTPEQMAKLAYDVRNDVSAYVDKHFRLTNNIDLSARYWQPIGFTDSSDVDHYFRGHFDGAGFDIIGLILSYSYTSNSDGSNNVWNGLFGRIYGPSYANRSQIGNFNLVSPVMSMASWGRNSDGWFNAPCDSGLVVGYSCYADYENITITNANQEACWWDGGFGGEVFYSSFNNIVIDSLTATICDWVYGGMVAAANECTFTDCHLINADITSEQTTWESRLGGLIGCMNDGVVVDGCSFNGIITAGHNNVGGVVGFAGDVLSTCEIKNTVIQGSISGNTYVGGIFGGMPNAATSLIFENCVNLASVTASGSTAGGIVAQVNGAVTLKQCANAGDISAPAAVGELFGSGSPTYTMGDAFPSIVSMSQGTADDILKFNLGGKMIKGTLEIGLDSSFSMTFATVPELEIYLDDVLLVAGVDYTIADNTLTFPTMPTSGVHKYVLVSGVSDTETYSRSSLVITAAQFAEMPTCTFFNDNGSTVVLNSNNKYTVTNYNTNDYTTKEYGLTVGTPSSNVELTVALNNSTSSADEYYNAISGKYEFINLPKANAVVTITAHDTADANKVDKTLSFNLVYSPFSSGLGTRDNPYIITRAEQFTYIKGDTHYAMGSDIDFSGAEYIPATSAIGRFTFDGNNYTISNFGFASTIGTIPNGLGLFGTVYGVGCEIRNINFESVNIVFDGITSTNAAVLVGYMSENDADDGTLLIENVNILDGSMLSKNCTLSTMGSLIGSVNGTTVNVVDCSVNLDIDTNSYYVGGMIGNISYLTPHYDYLKEATFNNCVYNGTIKCGSSATYVAGYIGKNEDASATFVDCTTNGYIESYSLASGFVCGSTNAINTFTNCINFADIAINSASTYGYGVYAFTAATNKTIDIDNCFNYGRLMSNGTRAALDINGAVYLRENQITIPVASVGDIDGSITNYEDDNGLLTKYALYSAGRIVPTATIVLTQATAFDLYIDGVLATLDTDYTLSQDGLTITVNNDGAHRIVVVIKPSVESGLTTACFIYDLDLHTPAPTVNVSVDDSTSTVVSGDMLLQDSDITKSYRVSYDTTGILGAITATVDGATQTLLSGEGNIKYFDVTVNNQVKQVVISVAPYLNFERNNIAFVLATGKTVSFVSSDTSMGTVSVDGVNGDFNSDVAFTDTFTLRATSKNSSMYRFIGWYKNYGTAEEVLYSANATCTVTEQTDLSLVAVFKSITVMPIINLVGGDYNTVITGNKILFHSLTDTTSTYTFTFGQPSSGTTIYVSVNGGARVAIEGNTYILANPSSDVKLTFTASTGLSDSVDAVYEISIEVVKPFPDGLSVAGDTQIPSSNITNSNTVPWHHDNSITDRTAYGIVDKPKSQTNTSMLFNFDRTGIFSIDVKVTTVGSARPYFYIYLNGAIVYTVETATPGWITYRVLIPDGYNHVEVAFYAPSISATAYANAWLSKAQFTQIAISGDGLTNTTPTTINIGSIFNLQHYTGSEETFRTGLSVLVDNGSSITITEQYVKLLGMTSDAVIDSITMPAGVSYTLTDGVYKFVGLTKGSNTITFAGTISGKPLSFTVIISNSGLDGYNSIVGNGTATNPYIINSWADIGALGAHPTGFFALADTLTDTTGIDNINKTITVSGTWTPIGTSAVPFKGGFDGNGWTIIITDVANVSYAGFFGYTNDATIKNFTLYITETSTSGITYFGGIVGYAGGLSMFDNIDVHATISVKANLGGLVGTCVTTSRFTNCDVYGSVRRATWGNCGGLSGNGGTFTDCNMYAEVSGYGLLGGLIGGYSTSSTFNNCLMAGSVTFDGAHTNNYPYVGNLNGYGAWVSFNYVNTGVQLTVKYNNSDRVNAVDIFNGEFSPILVSSSNDGTYTTLVYRMHLETTYASAGLLSETLVNGVTGNYGGFVVRFTMSDGTYKYISTLDRVNNVYRTSLDIDLDSLTSYVDNFTNMTIDTTIGTGDATTVATNTYKSAQVNGITISIFGTVEVSNANDFEHLQWIINGGIPTVFGSGVNAYFYNARSVATLSIKLTADIDLTADRIIEINEQNVYLNRVGGVQDGAKLYQFYGLGMSEMHPYRGSIYGNNNTLTVNMNTPNAYLVGIIAMSSDMSYEVQVRDLTVNGSIIGKWRVGVVGMFDGYSRSGDIAFHNVTVNATMQATAGRLGSLLGCLHTGKLTINNCTTNATMTGATLTGAYSGGNTHYSSKGVFLTGTNYNNSNIATLFGQLNASTTKPTAAHYATVKQQIRIHYGTGVDEYVYEQIGYSATGVAETTLTELTQLTIGASDYTIPATSFILRNGATYTPDHYVFLIIGSTSKTYDGATNLSLNANNYLGTWNITTNRIDVANANADTYTSISTGALVVEGNPTMLVTTSFSGVIINKKNISVTFGNTTQTYNGQSQQVTLMPSGLVGEDTPFDLTYYLTSDLDNALLALPINVASYRAVVTLNEQDGANYNLVGDTYINYSIGAYALTIMPNTLTKSYGESEPAWQTSVSGINDETVNITLTRALGDNVGVYAISVSTTNGNYTVAVHTDYDEFTITKRAVTITIADKSSIYGQSINPLTYAVTTGSIVGQDDLQV
ncbi:MAG: MBG domain-containing protein, partial [Clostridia bacterium]|nr:MBG domain-containing protein [Clostridia bacterium]